MDRIELFKDCNNKWLSNLDLLNTLRSIEADKCDVLFIHSSLSFGIPNTNIRRKDLLGSMLEVIKHLEVPTICMPTFTFSFPNGCIYNPMTSSSKMGALNEFFRKQEGVLRSIDPLMSVALYGSDKGLVTSIGHSSCGANSTFDLLHSKDNVKFLFLGTRIGDCMTYMHYLEWLYSVDYRYDRTFIGEIENGNAIFTDEYDLFVRYNSVIPNNGSYIFENGMYENGHALISAFGDSTISIVSEKVASIEYYKCLKSNPYFFVDFQDNKFIKNKTFTLNAPMVAL